MGLFNSLRKRSSPTREDETDSAERMTDTQKRRAKTVWPKSPTERPGIPWGIQLSKSEESSETKSSASEDTPLPKSHLPSSAPATTSLMSKDSTDSVQPDRKLRGRSRSWTKSNPFASLRKRSMSASPSSSPTRNFFYKAAELVKAPTSFFNKERVSEDSTKPLTRLSSPNKSLRSKKSVRFLSDDDNDHVAGTSPIPIPGSSAPSLPPVKVSASELMATGDANPAVLPEKPPATPAIKAVHAQPTAFIQQSEISRLPFPKDELPEYDESDVIHHLENPFADHTTLKGSAPVSSEHEASEMAVHEVEACSHEPHEHVPQNPFTTPADSRTNSLDALAILIRRANDAGQRLANIGDSAQSESLAEMSLPIRLKKPLNRDALNTSVGPHGDVGSGWIAPDRIAQELSDLGPAAVASPHIKDTGNMSRAVSDHKPEEHHSEEDFRKYAQISEEPSIIENTVDSDTRDKGEEKAIRCTISGSSETNSSLPERSGSRSPVRGRFRFENRTATDSDNQSHLSQTPKNKFKKSADARSPSPSMIPLPPSACPDQCEVLSRQANTFRDNHGWSPFADSQFVEAALDMILGTKGGDEAFAKLIYEPDGFVRFWNEHGLSVDTAPKLGSKPPTQEEAEDLVDAVIWWGRHLRARQPKKPTLRPMIKYFRDRGGSPTRTGFFAPVMAMNSDKSSDALSDEVYNLRNSSGEGSSMQTRYGSRSGSITPCPCLSSCHCGKRTAEAVESKESNLGPTKDCGCNPCTCNPCRCGEIKNDSGGQQSSKSVPTSDCTCRPCKCNPCQCSTTQTGKATNTESSSIPTPQCTCVPCICVVCQCGQVKDGSYGSQKPASIPTTDCACWPCTCKPCSCSVEKTKDCVCNPCRCKPCRCGIKKTQDGNQCHPTPTEKVSSSTIDDNIQSVPRISVREFSASSEPNQKTARRLPLIGTVPLRYFNGGSMDSTTTLASDTTLDEDEAYHAGML